MCCPLPSSILPALIGSFWGETKGDSLKEKVTSLHNWGIVARRVLVTSVAIAATTTAALLAISAIAIATPIVLSIALVFAAVFLATACIVCIGGAALIVASIVRPFFSSSTSASC